MFPFIFFIPMGSRSEKETCPNCRKPEDKMEVCKHCHYEYPEESSTWLGIVLGWVAVAGLILGAVFLAPQVAIGNGVGFMDYAFGGFVGAVGAVIVVALLVAFMWLGGATIEKIYGKSTKLK